MLGQLERADGFVIADLEAGVGNINRMAAHAVDALFVVVEATPKSIEVGQRAMAVAAERNVAPVRVIANRIRSADDLRMIRDAFGVNASVVVVPEDLEVLAADRRGSSVMDTRPPTPAVTVLSGVASSL